MEMKISFSGVWKTTIIMQSKHYGIKLEGRMYISVFPLESIISATDYQEATQKKCKSKVLNFREMLEEEQEKIEQKDINYYDKDKKKNR